jgi:hypothetical protein
MAARNNAADKAASHYPGKQIEICDHLPGSLFRWRTVVEFRGNHPAALSVAPL